MKRGVDNNLKVSIIVLFALAILTPLGLLTQNPAFGEWTEEEIKKMLGFVPEGLKRYAEVYKFDLFDGYSVKFISNQYIGYILSALIGIGVIFVIFFLLKHLMTERK
ncbi:cobalt/nickel transport protein [Caldicellulosiruptor bescii]|uniref:Cobalt/nickel transport protein n=1 Tax=Caldicellulosiruptor bescii TaxID=31899 RepID=A0ABY1SA89_CALBS|nr:PDGLE domain-containing protein [Caldicellulosiruptor bescii]PBC87385.1 cobalt/nickel transport protein [Caldicellulosiruptor bescii]PBC90325.1 cobalt/nickel transport protein [Caldicellulosiruptor bescii]PBD04247.1 cobalt/nickel transport protein [Caldicellulosiruptor bescii]PBD06122.1 cobalt/nickel transport protein [Caldicellulosiruptor bescii]PBD08878.1 cobalt/nickel transport protein [Caldicellulosiruptor bescii]